MKKILISILILLIIIFVLIFLAYIIADKTIYITLTYHEGYPYGILGPAYIPSVTKYKIYYSGKIEGPIYGSESETFKSIKTERLTINQFLKIKKIVPKTDSKIVTQEIQGYNKDNLYYMEVKGKCYELTSDEYYDIMNNIEKFLKQNN